MPIRTRRWCDPARKGDGLRLLICRYRPRALPKEKETWDAWSPDLGPSKELHADFYGKHGRTPTTWAEWQHRYVQEMARQTELIDELADLVREGKTVTLLCSSACKKANHCHRSLLKELIERAAERMCSSETTPAPSASAGVQE